MNTSYLKEPLTINKQLELLIKRGLSIPNPDFARHCLKTVSYYRMHFGNS